MHVDACEQLILLVEFSSFNSSKHLQSNFRFLPENKSFFYSGRGYLEKENLSISIYFLFSIIKPFPPVLFNISYLILLIFLFWTQPNR